MKYLVLIILIFFSQNYIMADEIDSNGIICDQNKEKSKRAPVKSFIYYFDDKKVYGIKVFKYQSPIKINKFLIAEYFYDEKYIKWEGKNASKVMKYYASVNRNNFILNLKFFYTSGSKVKNNTEKSFYCKWYSWEEIKIFMVN